MHNGYFDAVVNVHSLIVLGGGIFILYTAIKEIFHMFSLDDDDKKEEKKTSIASIVFWIILMNLIFSFDSILSALI